VQGVGIFATILPQEALEELEKLDQIEKTRKYLPFGEKVVKIGSVYTEINDKNCSLSIALTAMDQKLQKS